MAPNPNKANEVLGSYTKSRGPEDSVERTMSDMTLLEVKKQGMEEDERMVGASIWEVKNVKCECCGMSEECSEEYMKGVRHRFWGKFICGLCGEAVNETIHKNGGRGKEAVEEHMSACVKFNRMVRPNPVLYQAEAIKQILKKASRSRSSQSRSGTIVRSRSCVPSITS